MNFQQETNLLQAFEFQAYDANSNTSLFKFQNTKKQEELKQNEKKYREKIQLINKSQINEALFNNLLNQYPQLNLFIGLQVSPDGIIRHSQSLDYLSFGYQQQQIEKIVEDKQLNILSIVYQRNCQINRNSFDDVLTYLQQVPNVPYNYAHRVFESVAQIVELVQQRVKSIEVNDKVIQQKEQDVLPFLQYFGAMLNEYNQKYPNKMYWYSVSRINYFIQNTELIYTGFSKSYLQLLGVDFDTLTQLLLRGKKIDLIQNKLDINLQALLGLEFISSKGDINPRQTQILTLDGFPLKINQKKLFDCIAEKQSSYLHSDFGYCIVEVDVDIEGLKQLIQYRQRISNKGNVKIDDFINRELSYLFEDVEYSIQSQEFIQKYYEKNLKQVKKIEKQKDRLYKRRICNYKNINK